MTDVSPAKCEADMKKKTTRYFLHSTVSFFVVRAVGFEPTRRWHRTLKPARLPIPPCPRFLFYAQWAYTVIIAQCSWIVIRKFPR